MAVKPASLLPILAFGATLAGESASAGPIYRVTELDPSDKNGYVDVSYDGKNYVVDSKSGRHVYPFVTSPTWIPGDVRDSMKEYLEPKYAWSLRESVYNVYQKFDPRWMNSDGYIGGTEVWYEAPSYNPSSMWRKLHQVLVIRKFDGLGQLNIAWSNPKPYVILDPESMTPMNSSNQFALSLWGEGVRLVDLDTRESLDLSWIAADGTLRGDFRGGSSPQLPSALMPGAWALENAVAIDETGQILATGINSEGYRGRVLVTPVPEPATIWAFALIAGGLGVRRLKPRAVGRS